MADNKRGFKVWTSILSDDDFDTHTTGVLESIGRFTLLGAYVAAHGIKGEAIIREARLLAMMRVQSIDDLRKELPFKNVALRRCESDNGKISVSMRNWLKYQEDSNVYQRVKDWRKRQKCNGTRGEEKRGEDNRREEKKKQQQIAPSATRPEPAPFIPSCARTRQAEDALAGCKKVSLYEKSVIESWNTAYPDVDLAGEILKCEAWAQSKGITRSPKGWQRTLNLWLSKEQDGSKGSTSKSDNLHHESEYA